MIQIEIRNKNNEIVMRKVNQEGSEEAPCQAIGKTMAVLTIKDYVYQEGDWLFVQCSGTGYPFFVVQLEETLAPTLLYIPGGEWSYEIPLQDSERRAMIDTAFLSHRHHLMVRRAYEFEVTQYQNLSFNSYDQKEFTGAYPHASANVETRDEVVFFAKNAIDGKYGNLSHGSYPFTSWGINQQSDAELMIDFGRVVEVDWIQFLFRGDYPHDSYWTEVTLEFSGDRTIQSITTNSLAFQEIRFPMIQTKYIKFKNLKKNHDQSPFPALSQIEIFGRNKY